MDSYSRGVSDDHQENLNSNTIKKASNRRSTYQTSILEEIFTTVTHPNDKQRCDIATELGMDPNQVKFWFQNKRSQQKTQNEKATSSALLAENERLLNENNQMKEELKNKISCSGSYRKNHEDYENSMRQLQLKNARLKEETQNEKATGSALRTENERLFNKNNQMKEELKNKISCSGPYCKNHEDYEKSMQQLQLENARLKEEHERMSKFIATHMEKIPVVSDENILVKPTCRRTEMEKIMMLEVAIAAKEELLKLLSTNDPLWVKSHVDQRLVLHQKNYEDVFPIIDHFNGAKTRVESSKDSKSIRFGARHLVKLLLDSEDWKTLFPTIVTKAETIEVLEEGSSENRSGVLQLMYEEMHVLSPFVPSREFYLLRYSEQVEAGTWVIANVSYDCSKEGGLHSPTWMFPSGCLIHQISNEYSQVSWVEHVEVVDKIQTHRLYKDVVNLTIAFGAERRLLDLQRMSEKFSRLKNISIYDSGVVTLLKGKKSVVHLSHRMVKDYCKILSLLRKSNIPQSLADVNDSKIMLAIRKSGVLFKPNNNGTFMVATSVLFPFPSQMLFDFLRDPARRFQWDDNYQGNPMHEIAHISTGGDSNNYISIIQPMEPPPPNGVVIIQECFIDPLASYVVFSPLNIPDLKDSINGKPSSTMSLLSSGFIIFNDSQSHSRKNARSSLLTVAFQLSMSSLEGVNLDVVAKSFMTKTINNIRDSLIV